MVSFAACAEHTNVAPLSEAAQRALEFRLLIECPYCCHATYDDTLENVMAGAEARMSAGERAFREALDANFVASLELSVEELMRREVAALSDMLPNSPTPSGEWGREV